MEDITEKCKKSRLPEGEEYIFGKEAILQNDIKILEALIKEHKKLGNTSEETRISKTLFERIIQAIQNLIARNKELESALNNSVSKDEIKTKIKEWNDLKAKIEASQELLNKGE